MANWVKLPSGILINTENLLAVDVIDTTHAYFLMNGKYADLATIDRQALYDYLDRAAYHCPESE